MEIVLLLVLVLLALGLIENALHQRRLKKIPIRIHVNGTRGKSTTTRLIAGMLRQAGYRVIAKTTGTAPKVILGDGSEVSIKRRGKPSIIEQVKIVTEAAKRQADVLVIECMAVNPEMQWVSEQRILQSTIGVITNAREDHLDVMGSTDQDVANALALAIPRSGKLVVGEKEFFAFFKEEAKHLHTSVHLADLDTIDNLDAFSYMMFKENVASALKVGEFLGVPHDIAWEGMANATPDLGSTQIYSLGHSAGSVYFVNALAANDLTSTRLVWQGWQSLSAKLSIGHIPVVGLLNNRADRSFRVPELAQLAGSELPLDCLLITGGLVALTKRYLKQQRFDLQRVSSHNKPSVQRIIDDMSKHYNGDIVLFAYGNTQGFGEQLIDFFDRNGERVSNDLTSDGARSGS